MGRLIPESVSEIYQSGWPSKGGQPLAAKDPANPYANYKTMMPFRPSEGVAPRVADPGPVASSIGASEPQPEADLPGYGTFSAPTDMLDYQGGDSNPEPGTPFSCQVDGVYGPSANGRTQAIIKQINGADLPPDSGAELNPDDMTGAKLQELAGQADSNMGMGPGAGAGY